MIEVADALNSFAPVAMQTDFVPPSDQLVTLTYGQLQDLIREATEPLREEIQDLKDEMAALQTDLKRFHVFRNTGRVDDLFEAVEDIEARVDKRPTEPTQKTLDHLTEIAMILGAAEKRLIENQAPRAYLTKLRTEGVTFSQLATRMGLTVDRIRQLSRIAATDQRFNICWHPRKKNTKIIKLRRWDVQGL